jgi:glutaminyl-tRNA synthetase
MTLRPRPNKADPEDVPEGVDWLTSVNANSMRVVPHAYAEKALLDAKPGQVFQFERVGYFTADPDSREDADPRTLQTPDSGLRE